MGKRTVSVEFKAEVRQSRADLRGFAREVGDVRKEAAKTREELGRFANSAQQATNEVAKFSRDANGKLRDARGRFVSGMAAAGSEAGTAFGNGFTRDAQGRLRDARGRFVREGEKLGEEVGRGFKRGSKRGSSGSGDGIFSSFASVGAGGRTMLLLAGGAGAAVAALQGIPPILAAIGGGLGAIPSLAAGATGSILTLVAATHGIGDAIGEVFDPPKSGGGGSSAINQTAAAERRLAAAQREVRDAQLALNRARVEAARDLRDMRLELTGAQIDEREAALDLRDAERDLREAEQSGRPDDIERAQLAYDRAKLAVEETANRVQDLTVDQAEAAKAGVEGSDQVQAALRRQQAAAEAVLDAQEALTRTAAGGGGAAAVVTAYSKLSPEARKFVDQIARLKPELVGLQQLAQNRVFAGLGQELFLTADKTLPFARKQVIRFGDTWNQTFKQLFRLGRDPQFLAGLDTALASSDRFFDKVNARIPSTGRMLAQLWTDSAPFVDRFGDSVLSLLDDFNAFIDRASRSGRLDDFFKDAAEQADALVDLTKEVFRIVARIGGMDQGSTVLRDMADAVKRFNDEAHSMDDVQGIIDTGNAAIRGLVDVLLMLGESLGETLADPGTRDSIKLFFEVLKVGVQVIGDLLAVFRLLPDPLQAVLLTGLAMGLAWKKLHDIGIKLAVATFKVSDRLAEIGPAGERAGKGLEATVRWAGRALTALAAWEAATAISEHLREDSASVDKLRLSLEKLAKTGEDSGELSRIFGEDMDQWRVNLGLAESGIGGFGRQLETIMPGIRNWEEWLTGSSWSRAKENIGALDDALADMVQRGDLDTAQQAVEELALRSGKSVSELTALMPNYTAAVGEAAKGTFNMGAALRTMEEGARDSLTASIDLEEAIDRANEVITENGKSLDINTEAGRENMRALVDIANKSNEASEAKLRETGSVAEANEVYKANRQRLIDAAIQAGATKQKAAELADQLLKTPDVDVTFTTPGLAEAIRRAREYKEQLESIVRIVNSNFNQGTVYRGLRWGGAFEHAAVGKLRDAGVYSSQNPARYAFAEPATGGEAFIPRYGDRDRSVSIGRRAMEWYGYDVVPKAAMARSSYGSAMQSWSGPSAAQIGAAVASHLAPALTAAAAASGGDIVVQVDAVEIARATRRGERDLTRR